MFVFSSRDFQFRFNQIRRNLIMFIKYYVIIKPSTEISVTVLGYNVLNIVRKLLKKCHQIFFFFFLVNSVLLLLLVFFPHRVK